MSAGETADVGASLEMDMDGQYRMDSHKGIAAKERRESFSEALLSATDQDILHDTLGDTLHDTVQDTLYDTLHDTLHLKLHRYGT